MKPQSRKGWWTGYVIDVSAGDPTQWHEWGKPDQRIIDKDGNVIQQPSESSETPQSTWPPTREC